MQPPEIDRTVRNIPIKDIYCDNDFNCRGKIAPLEVLDLAQDIKENGLDFPIVVQEYALHPPHKWRIITGHRRFMAFRINKSEEIPCTVRVYKDEFDAACANLRENIQRSQLNIKQEAHGIRKFYLGGWTESQLAEKIKQSRGWVQIRYALLTLPEEIQNEAAAGLITQPQILKMKGLRVDDQFALLRAIKTAKFRGETVDVPVEKKRDHLNQTKKPQDRATIFFMIDHFLQVTKAGLHTRCLAWAAGEISDWELYKEIKEHCDKNHIAYEIPKDIVAAVKLRNAS